MRKISIIGFIALFSVLIACTNKAQKYYNKGYSKFKQEEFEYAIADFKQALELKAPTVAESNYYIAESYRLSNRIHLAEKHYKIAIDNEIDNEQAQFYYAFALKANQKYDSTTIQLKKYLEIGENFNFKDRAKKELANLKLLKQVQAFDPKYVVENCDGLNTAVMEYSPVLLDNKLYYTSSTNEGPIFPGQGNHFSDLFEFSFDGGKTYTGTKTPLPSFINFENTHEASATFARDGKYMIFSRSNDGEEKNITKEVDLFDSKFVNGKWTEPKRLDICESLAWDSNPCLSADGNTLYFSSNRDGGLGGDDIWKASFSKYDSVWFDVINLGPEINTGGNEQFPYLRKDGRLFFCSDGHVGFGGLDVFEYKKDKRIAKNLGKPINTSFDDFSIFFENDTTGYFASNRLGGKGDDDIYHFGYSFRPKVFLTGTIKEFLEEEDEKIIENSEVILLDLEGNEIGRVETDSLGNYQLLVGLDKKYIVKVISDKYITKEHEFSTIGKGLSRKELLEIEEDIVFTEDLKLIPVKEDLILDFPPIYYDYNKWDIKKQAADILDQMVKVMKDNPSILVELGSHTDNQGSMKYNDILSQKRAEKAVEYIIGKGIPTDRITAKGYGERKPLVLRKDTASFITGTELSDVYIDKLSNDSLKQTAYQLNRRTEFKIVGFIGKEENLEKIKVIKNNEKEGIVEEEKIKKEEYIIDKHLKKED